MRWTPLATRSLVGLGITGLLVAGLTTGSAQAAFRGASAAPADVADPTGRPAAGDSLAGALPTMARPTRPRLRARGPAGRTVVTVRFRTGLAMTSAVRGTALATTIRGHDATPRSTSAALGTATYTVPDAEAASFLAALAARPEVASARRTQFYSVADVPNDTDYEAQQKSYLTSIAAPAGWDYGHGSAAVKIAVVDSGVDVGHPDLVGKVVDQYDVVTDTTDVSDPMGHGTAVAGIAAAATNNAQGIAGVGFDASIIAIKVAAADGSLADVDVAEGIRKAADLGATIINASLVAPAADAPVAEAVKYAQRKGALIVAAAGNDAQAGNPTMYPAALPGVLAVGATDGKGHRAAFSEHGPWVSLAAPGVGIRVTTSRTLDPALTLFSTPGYDSGDGTSFAAPMVAGAAALLAARAPGATADQLRATLVSTAHGYRGYGLGTGQLDVERAMATITPTTKPTMTLDPATPTVGEFVRATGTATTSRTRLALYVDGVQVSTPGTPLVWRTAGYPQTPHTVELRECAPRGGCATTGSTARVTPQWAAPTISLTEGATVSGAVRVRVPSTSSSLGIAILVDGVRVAADLVGTGTGGTGTTEYAPEVNFTRLPDGPHTVQAVICNRAGTRCQGARSPKITVTSTSLPVSGRGASNAVFSPNGDGVKDTVSVPFTLGSAQTVKATIVDSAGTAVRAVSIGAKPAGTHTFTWNGTTDRGTPATAGSYQLRIATSMPGRPGISGLATATTRVDRTAPTLTAPTGSGTTVYPVVDRYRDSFTPSVTVNETARLTLTVRNAAGRAVYATSRPNVTGRQRLRWNGRTTAGALVPAGSYTYAFTATDAGGSTRSTPTQLVSVSRQKLVTVTTTITQKGTDTAGNTNSSCVTVTHTGSSYPDGMWLKNDCPQSSHQLAASIYRFALPRAVSYRAFTLSTSGRSHSQPAEVVGGLFNAQIGTYEWLYPTQRVTTSTTRTLALGTLTGAQHAVDGRTGVVVFVPNAVYGPLTDWDLQTVALKVAYTVLR